MTGTLARGGWGTVEAATDDSGEVLAESFLSGEPVGVTVKFAELFQQMANYGPTGMQPKRFKKEMGDLWAFRHEINNRQYRFPCFRDGNRWIVTHGFVKPGAKNKKMGEWPTAQVERAERIQNLYLSRKQATAGGKS